MSRCAEDGRVADVLMQLGGNVIVCGQRADDTTLSGHLLEEVERAVGGASVTCDAVIDWAQLHLKANIEHIDCNLQLLEQTKVNAAEALGA